MSVARLFKDDGWWKLKLPFGEIAYVRTTDYEWCKVAKFADQLMKAYSWQRTEKWEQYSLGVYRTPVRNRRNTPSRKRNKQINEVFKATAK